ncbi:nucleotidyltransferase domain-containing protein [Chitinophaga pendula]|uniref:nucleotidyltransferase domain-containing protein n=1 Tax=Chitinophaga TaxID=79328 RepID=UPI000BAEBC27|nr:MULTISPECIES: nucleotidyltransferase domain-containing protein [Chitinophaga]ASZ14792.1 nucleotidyltransferase [Chitinophaga sp. MD30]UCJ06854.1 nucleotidyltransferase domain-containing protein [Chitinophaga pendula]
MKDIILQQLKGIEQEHNVTILYACESGSRAWGFASPDSDYDVRFIYAQRSDAYLSIRERRDVIELPVNEVLDISGWDLRKALQLFLKSNAPLYEWLQSPIVYQQQAGFTADIQTLMPAYFSLRAGLHHYLSMADNTFTNDLQGVQVRLKKYFYALRPLLAARWITDKQRLPPMQFEQLRTLIADPVWQQEIEVLLQKKQAADEKAVTTPLPFLQGWLSDNLVYCKEKGQALAPVTHDTAELDELFRKYIPS